MWMWTSVLRFIKELNVKSSVGARYYQLQVAEINPLESGEHSAFPAAAAAAPRFPQQSAASILIKSQLFPGMSLTQYLDQISPSSTSNHIMIQPHSIFYAGVNISQSFCLGLCLYTAILTCTFSRNTKSRVSGRAARSSLLNIQKKI